MKALTLTQPWASLVANGEKKVETRSWSTQYRGPLAIHAAKGFPGWAKDTCKEEPFYSSLRVGGNYAYPELMVGSVLCVVELRGCVKTQFVRNTLTPKEISFGDYDDDRYAWFLEFTRKLKKEIPAKGHLGLWDWVAPEVMDAFVVQK